MIDFLKKFFSLQFFADAGTVVNVTTGDVNAYTGSGNTTNAANASKGLLVAKNNNYAYVDYGIGEIINGAAVYNTYKTNIFTLAGGEDVATVSAYIDSLAV